MPDMLFTCGVPLYHASSEFRDQDCLETGNVVHLRCTVHLRRFSAQQAHQARSPVLFPLLSCPVRCSVQCWSFFVAVESRIENEVGSTQRI